MIPCRNDVCAGKDILCGIISSWVWAGSWKTVDELVQNYGVAIIIFTVLIEEHIVTAQYKIAEGHEKTAEDTAARG